MNKQTKAERDIKENKCRVVERNSEKNCVCVCVCACVCACVKENTIFDTSSIKRPRHFSPEQHSFAQAVEARHPFIVCSHMGHFYDEEKIRIRGLKRARWPLRFTCPPDTFAWATERNISVRPLYSTAGPCS